MRELLKIKKSRTPVIDLADEPCRAITLTHRFLSATDRRVSIDDLVWAPCETSAHSFICVELVNGLVRCTGTTRP